MQILINNIDYLFLHFFIQYNNIWRLLSAFIFISICVQDFNYNDYDFFPLNNIFVF